MSQINVLRPVSTMLIGAGSAVPSGTLHGVTSDNSDSTYIGFTAAPPASNNWSLRVASHTPPAGHQRHRIRGRVRARTDTGTLSDDIDLGRGSTSFITYTSFTASDTFTEYAGDWFQDAAFGLATPGALADLNIGGGWVPIATATGGAAVLRTSECYVDIDCRMRPDFTPEVRDAAGVDQSGGTITDTAQPTLHFGAPAYDDLPPLDWAVAIIDTNDALIANITGDGTPPATIPVTVTLADGAYSARFTVRSTIRGSDPFPYTATVDFTVDNVVPPPSPPLLTVEESFGGYLVSWVNPGGQEWDTEMPLVAEVWRDDCTGSQRIATIPDGLNGSYLDLAIPQVDVRPDCEDPGAPCDITYRVRYWGYVSTTVEIPDVIPIDLILAWPGSVASIPDGWTRVTELDGRYPRGAPGTGAPTATGGAASHTHTTPNHRHIIGAHRHTVGSTSTGSFDSVQTARKKNGDVSTASQSHNHDLPLETGTRDPLESSLVAPGTDAVANTPITRDVIWIRSDGTRTAYPVGVLAWSAQSVSGWTKDSTSSGRFLRGAAAGAPGGPVYGFGTHQHEILSHTHFGVTHAHPIGNTGLSNPRADDDAMVGENSDTRFLSRHTHPMNVVPASTGNLLAATGGDTGVAPNDPVHRRLNVLRNTGGGAQTRIIGLYLGTVAALNPVLTLCDGRAGTPDMRNLFARDTGTGSVNSVAGSNTHRHSTPTHRHFLPPHRHEVEILASESRRYRRQGGGDQGSVPTVGHTHSRADSDLTMATVPSLSAAGSGNTNTVSNIPPYREAHFVRVDGTVAGGDLPIPELRITEFASMTVPAFTHTDGLDRISSTTDRMAIGADRSSNLPRVAVETTPLTGGPSTVATTRPGEDISLTIAVEGMPAITRLESILTAERVYWSPLGGTPGWFAPAGWTVASPVPNVKVVQVTMTRQPWPSTVDPEDLL